MRNPLKVMTIFGTRPEAIKMAPLVLELTKRKTEFTPIVTITAQHREMLDQVLGLFDITPDHDLDMMKHGQTLAQITARAVEGLDAVMKQAKPDIVLVHGDTSTTFAASLAAYYNEIAIAHVEAGLRTHDKYSPFPEEMNRQLTDVLADFYFAPTDKARQNLKNENKPAERLFVTGNTAIDALATTVNDTYTSPVLQHVGNKRLVLLTAHRRENLGENMRGMFRAVKSLVETHADIHVIYPVHLNPKVRSVAKEVLGDDPRIQLIEPLDVIDFHNIAARSHLILTDSGGIQEEAPSLGVPVLVLRNTTERPEGVEAGTLKLVGTSEEAIFDAAHALLTQPDAYEKMARASNPYGDGKASSRIADIIINHGAE